MKGPFLEVIGQGVVHPAGCSVTAFLEGPVPAPTLEPLLSPPQRNVPVRRIDLKQDALLRWQHEPRLRRASPLGIYLMEAAHQAVASAPNEPGTRMGLVCALSTGSILYSRKFFTQTETQGRHLASPVLFPETVYNSPVSHVAAILKITEGCYTLMGDESAWVQALRVAQVWLARDTVDSVLVVGGEELDVLALEAFNLAGWVRRGLVGTEGAGAVLVQAAAASSMGPGVIRVHPRSIPFRNRAEQVAAWTSFAREATADLPLLLPGNTVPSSSWKKFVSSTGARELGEDGGFAFTASAAWSFLQALEDRKENGPSTLLVPGANAAVSAVSFL